MKVERCFRGDRLWRFFQKHLPSSLVAKDRVNGYGRDYSIELPKTHWFNLPDVVARVYETHVELFRPEYFSDFEDICKRYEQETKEEVTLKFWES